MTPCAALLAFVCALQVCCWAQLEDNTIVKPIDIPTKIHPRRTENEEPIDEEVLKQFKTYAIANSKIVLELGKQELRLLSYLSGRDTKRDLLFGTPQEEIKNMEPLVNQGSTSSSPTTPSSNNSPGQLTVPLPSSNGITSSGFSQNSDLNQQAPFPFEQSTNIASTILPPSPTGTYSMQTQLNPVLPESQTVVTHPDKMGSTLLSSPVITDAITQHNTVSQTPEQFLQPVTATQHPTYGTIPTAQDQSGHVSTPPTDSTLQELDKPSHSQHISVSNINSVPISDSHLTDNSPGTIPFKLPTSYPSAFAPVASEPISNADPQAKPYNPLAGDVFHHTFDSIPLPALKPADI